MRKFGSWMLYRGTEFILESVNCELVAVTGFSNDPWDLEIQYQQRDQFDEPISITRSGSSGLHRKRLSDGKSGDWKAIQRAGHEALTQIIGREARSAGFEAILTMSARRNDGLNLVIFPDRVFPESTIVMGPLLD